MQKRPLNLPRILPRNLPGDVKSEMWTLKSSRNNTLASLAYILL